MDSPLGSSSAALRNSACVTRCTTTAVLLATSLLQSSQHVAEAAVVTTTCASNKPALDCGSGMVDEACTQRKESISSLCYCVDGIARYCSDICHDESKSLLCMSNCPEFSEREGKPCSLLVPTNDLPLAWIVGPVLFLAIVVIIFSVTFVRYKRRVTIGGAPSFRGYLKYLRCGPDEVGIPPIEQDNTFPGVDGNAADNDSDYATTPLHHVQPNESVNGATVSDSGLAHD